MVSRNVTLRLPLRTGASPLLGLGLLLWLAGSCHGDPEEVAPPAADSLAGCWALEVAPADGGDWRPVDRPGVPPAVRLEAVRLDSAEVPGRQPARRARSLVDGRERDHPFAAWRFLREDSLWVGHPAAYAGHTLRLARGGDTLVGTLATYTDVLGGEVPPDRAARLVRTACPDDGEAGDS